MFQNDHNIQFEVLSIDEVSLDQLLPPEQELANLYSHEIAQKRFIAGRVAARRLLRKNQISDSFALLRSKEGAVIWPTGIVGSIAHTDTAAVAAIAEIRPVHSIGVDIEPSERDLKEGIEKRILTETEKDWVQKAPDQIKTRLLITFSAKEAIFKALSPIGAGKFYFLDAELLPVAPQGDAIYAFESKIKPIILNQCSVQLAPKIEVFRWNNFFITLAVVS